MDPLGIFLLYAAALEEDENVEIRVVKSRDRYYEDVIPTYLPDEFQQHFCFTRKQFQGLVKDLQFHHLESPQPLKTWPLERLILASIVTLVSNESYRQVANRFQTSKSVICEWLHYFIRLLVDCKMHRISFPDENGMRANVAAFHRMGFPGTVGAIGECHVPILKPQNDAELYLNAEGGHCVKFLAICDSQNKFIHVNAGEPGSFNPSWALPECWLETQLSQPSCLPIHRHIIGDILFPLLTTLMVPYEGKCLTTCEQLFNVQLGLARASIDCTFDLLKSRFKCLKTLRMRAIKEINLTIQACCIMHNMTTNFDDGEVGSDICDEDTEMEYALGTHKKKVEASLKRDYIAGKISSRQAV